jgi:hypothetical protein
MATTIAAGFLSGWAAKVRYLSNSGGYTSMVGRFCSRALRQKNREKAVFAEIF